jgi:hypothetical protein
MTRTPSYFEYAERLPRSRPEGRDPYNSLDTPPRGDVVEFTVPDTIEVITLCSAE